MDKDKKIEEICEAVVIVTGLNELILTIETDQDHKNCEHEALVIGTIAYIKHIRGKYYALSRTKMTIDKNGNIVPI